MDIDSSGNKSEELLRKDLLPDCFDSRIRTRVFVVLVTINALMNYDTGVIPASLKEIEQEMGVSFKEKAAIGSMVYIGICSSSLVVPMAFQNFSASKILLLMLILNSLFCFLFSFSYSTELMYFARFGMGFTQAFSVIYAPVWINEFAPKEKCTRWIGILQCAVPLGIVFGYGIASLFNSIGSESFNWRFAIRFQALMEVPLMLLLFFTGDKYIDVVDPNELESAGQISPRSREMRFDAISLNNLPGFFHQLKFLVTNMIFVFLTLALCCMFFVVSGIQYWVTIYMKDVLSASSLTVVIGFVLISSTAPICGVLTGGYIADYYGGYKGRNILTAVKICVLFGVLAFIVSIPSGLVKTTEVVTALLWLLLYFGGCIVPSAVGITVNTMPKELQSSSSSISQLMFNFVGFFLSPILSAAIMDQFDDRKEAITWGFRFTLYSSFISLSFIVIAYLVIANDDNLYAYEVKDLERSEKSKRMIEISRRIKPIVIN